MGESTAKNGWISQESMEIVAAKKTGILPAKLQFSEISTARIGVELLTHAGFNQQTSVVGMDQTWWFLARSLSTRSLEIVSKTFGKLSSVDPQIFKNPLLGLDISLGTISELEWITMNYNYELYYIYIYIYLHYFSI